MTDDEARQQLLQENLEDAARKLLNAALLSDSIEIEAWVSSRLREIRSDILGLKTDLDRHPAWTTDDQAPGS
jgi:hypothetical protein